MTLDWIHNYYYYQKAEGGEEDLKHATYFTRRSTVTSPWTTGECTSTTIEEDRTTILFIDQRETKRNKEIVHINTMNVKKYWRKCKKQIFFWRQYMCGWHILFVVFAFSRYIYQKILRERENKITYIFCKIVFEINSCEFSRTTINAHRTTLLFVITGNVSR